MHSRATAETWADPARVELLKKLWADGLSCSQIAGEIGGGVSRNAVIGKVTRLGLDKRAQPVGRGTSDGGALARRISGRNGHSDRSATQRIRKLKVRGLEHGGPVMLEAPQREPDPKLEDFNAAIPQEQRRTILDLDNETCHWPCGEVGEPGFFFCGGEAEEDRPYCRFHMKAAYYPPRPRVERPYLPTGGSKVRAT